MSGRRGGSVGLGALGLALTLLLSACASAGEREPASSEPASSEPASSEPASSEPGDREPGEVLGAPGGALADGLVAPDGSMVIGSVLREAQATDQGGQAPDGWTALVALAGDPFVAFDDLAGQIRDGLGAPMPGTADSCWWSRSAEEPGPPSRIGASAPSGGSDGVRCGAVASTERDGDTVAYEIQLRWVAAEPAILVLRRSHWPADLGAVAEGETAMAIAGWDDGSYDDLPPPSEERVPEGASRYLVEPAALEVTGELDAGEAFGPAVRCFAASGPTRFEAPAGTAGAVVLPEEAILAVEDADAALDELRSRFEATSVDGESETETTVGELADGTLVTRYSHGIMAGGDSCSVTTSSDGRHLRITFGGG